MPESDLNTPCPPVGVPLAMTKGCHLLACLAEECSEVIQRVVKAMRFTLSEIQPGQPHDNAVRLERELTDLFAVYQMAVEAGLIDPIDLSAANPAIQDKKAKVYQYLMYSGHCGAVIS